MPPPSDIQATRGATPTEKKGRFRQCSGSGSGLIGIFLPDPSPFQPTLKLNCTFSKTAKKFKILTNVTLAKRKKNNGNGHCCELE
jgi:hypothetical protein